MIPCILDSEKEFVAKATRTDLNTDNSARNVAETEQGAMDGLKRQEQYVKSLEDKGCDFSLIVADAFVISMKSIGYKHTGTALAEDVDNSLEAAAQKIKVLFGYDAKTEKKPARLAVIDDGHGMSPQMIRAAVLWGGGNRRDRKMFGRYGFGLPSSSVSIGDRFEVYSKVAGGEWHMTYIDLWEIAEGTCFKSPTGAPAAPPAKPKEPPVWVKEGMAKEFGTQGLVHGTVIVIDKITNLTWKTTDNLERELLEFFGITYRNYLNRVDIFVNDKQVEIVDPLFLNPLGRFYDVNGVKAEGLEPLLIEVKNPDTKASQGLIKVRFSFMPPSFQRPEGKLHKGRFNVMKENNGIVVLRASRQLDVIPVPQSLDWHTFQNYDRNYKIEIDFPPQLDEEFSVTTTKQQVRLSDRIWAILEEHGLRRAIKNLRARVEQEFEEMKLSEEKPAGTELRPSESIMVEAEKYKVRLPDLSPEQEREREQRRDEEIQKRAKEQSKPLELVKEEIMEEEKRKPYELKFEDAPESPYYRSDGVGVQIELILNKAHTFYSQVYMAPGSTPRFRSALELMLFAMAETEQNAPTPRRLFYEGERRLWSERLSILLRLLENRDPKGDIVTANIE